MEPEICTIRLNNTSERLRAKFPAAKLSYSMVKTEYLNDALSGIF